MHMSQIKRTEVRIEGHIDEFLKIDEP